MDTASGTAPAARLGEQVTSSGTAPAIVDRVGFVATFLPAWFVLDRLATAPPTVVSSVVALAADQQQQ